MDLDVYVGPLSRYLARSWKADGEDPDGAADPADFLEDARAWKDDTLEWLVEKYGRRARSAWDERTDGEYLTARPGWAAYRCLLALAVVTDRRNLRRPETVREAIEDQELLRRIDPRSSAYPQLLATERWLPIDRNIVFRQPMFTDEAVLIGSAGALFRQLTRLNAFVLRGDAEDLENWRHSPATPDAPFEDGARHGLAVIRHMAAVATRLQYPMLLDY